ncbi:MAG: Smr/MutS family protein [Syntrophomonadaceae bacterium]|jgi:hypothetical protein
MKIEHLDLHGLSLLEALEKTSKNLNWCINHGVDILDINHGKGYHSDRGFSVIKTEIRKMLKQQPLIKENGYKVIYGESNLPVALSFDEGHTLVIARGIENNYLGDKKQKEKNYQLYSDEARKKRKKQKEQAAIKRKRFK